MKTFRVTGWETLKFDYIVEAESLEAAEDWEFIVVRNSDNSWGEERLDGDLESIEEQEDN